MGCGTSRVRPQPLEAPQQTRKSESRESIASREESKDKDEDKRKAHQSSQDKARTTALEVVAFAKDGDSVASQESAKMHPQEKAAANGAADAKDVDDEFDYPIPYSPHCEEVSRQATEIDAKDKEATVHIRFVNEDETDMYCAFPAETSFWQIISKMRTAYGLPICFKDPISKQIISTTAQYSTLLKAYQKNEAEHLEILTITIDSPDIDDMDDFEHTYEEKKSQVFLKCTLDDDEPIDCTFPMPFGLMELKGYFRGLKDGAMLVTLQYGKIEPVFVRDNDHFQQVLSDYQKSFYKYLQVVLKHKVISDIEQDEEEELLMEKKNQIRIEFHIESDVYEIICPPSVDLESLKSRAIGLISGDFKIMSLDGESSNHIPVDDEKGLRLVIDAFCTSPKPKLQLFINSGEGAMQHSS